ncbi:MAG: hypothetical protein LBQ87_07210 [Candidatus Fibromonas sp.]|jgi:uncharacterized protein (TIGR02145 family)|nr:hypothetical protein [Candidatus Fibromonas sp.]
MKKVLFFAMLVFATGLLFSCSDDPDPSDPGSADKGNDIGNYKTVVIGTQTWMAENLNYAVAGSKCYGEGGKVIIDRDEDDMPITKTLSPAEVQSNCTKYGRLYDWVTAMALPSSCNESSCSSQIQSKHQGICPSGWHIPSNDDWNILMNYAGGYETAGIKLKATSGWYDNGNGTDDYSFSALPGGLGGFSVLPGSLGQLDDSFSGVGGGSYWWSARELNGNGARCLGVYYNDYDARGDCIKYYLLSVRCLQD